MTPISNDALLVHIQALREDISEVKDDVREIKSLQKIANGRVSKIESARAEEKGARDAVAQAAANTAASLQAAKSLREKSRTWKAAVIAAVLGSVGGVVTAGSLVAHAITNH